MYNFPNVWAYLLTCFVYFLRCWLRYITCGIAVLMKFLIPVRMICAVKDLDLL